MSGGEGGAKMPEGVWDRVWVQLSRATWSSVALVPISPRLHAGPLAEALAAVGSLYRGGSVRFLDAAGIGRHQCRSLIDQVRTSTETHGLVLAVDPPALSDPALLLTREVSAAVLVLELEDTLLAEARRTVDLVGREKILGAVTLNPEGSWLRSESA